LDFTEKQGSKRRLEVTCVLSVNELTVGIIVSLLPLVMSTGCVIFFKSA